MEHRADPEFWRCFSKLSAKEQAVARKAFEKLKLDPKHPALHFKKIGRFWSVRSSLEVRAVGVQTENLIVWFWIGRHSEYEELLG